MRTHHIVALLVTGAAAMAAAQTTTVPPSPPAAPTTSASPAPTRIDKPLVLVGCVAAEGTSANRFTLSDAKTGVRYRLTGKPVALYSGRRVRIIGGLYPSANVAAQAGGIDPTKAAMAAAQPSGMGRADPVEFTITSVRPVSGVCPP